MRPSRGGGNGFWRAGSIIWNQSSAQEKTRVDLLALSSLELHFTIAVAQKVAPGRLERLLHVTGDCRGSSGGRADIAHTKPKEGKFRPKSKKQLFSKPNARICLKIGPHDKLSELVMRCNFQGNPSIRLREK